MAENSVVMVKAFQNSEAREETGMWEFEVTAHLEETKERTGKFGAWKTPHKVRGSALWEMGRAWIRYAWDDIRLPGRKIEFVDLLAITT